jgi:hypothetical protein
MAHLLRSLRRFMRAYPITQEDQMPDHDLVWVDELNDGPARVILEAIKANPALWREALPEGVCIMPRKALEKMTGMSSDMIDYLASYGENIVLYHAAEHKHQQDEKKRDAWPTPAKPD